jgi:tRNA nucleotidyltransferase (CCA-adding enzyme)
MTTPDDEQEQRVRAIARAVHEAGGRALLVGGCVRDRVMERSARDLDVEVFGITESGFMTLLGRFGRVFQIGRSFPVIRLQGLEVDFTLCDATADDFAQVSRRRDLTMNSMAIDPLDDRVLDPHGGREDIAARRLRATDPASFGSDPLRALRVARFSACFDMQPDAELLDLCSQQDLAAVAGERSFEEIRRLLVEAPAPARGFALLEGCGLLGCFPEIRDLMGVPQDPEWHPEGDVFVHTLMVVDAAARLRRGDDDDLALMLGALCHDFGKPATTASERGRIRSLGHDHAGIEPTIAFLQRLRASNDLVTRVCALVEHHLAPALFIKNDAGARGFRRLVRKLDRAEVSVDLLVRVARADHLGRTTDDAIAGVFHAGDAFLERAAALGLDAGGAADVVLGRHLMARGIAPGPEMGRLLEACRAIQDESGETDPERILERLFRAGP